MQTEDKLYFATRLLIYGGLLGFGVAAGSKLGFNIVHAVCVSHGWTGVLIMNGEPSVCTRAVLRLNTAIQIGGYGGGIALLIGGVLDSYNQEVAAWIQ